MTDFDKSEITGRVRKLAVFFFFWCRGVRARYSPERVTPVPHQVLRVSYLPRRAATAHPDEMQIIAQRSIILDTKIQPACDNIFFLVYK